MKRDQIKTRLDEITLENGGVLTPDAVVADAKKKTSPLHNLFEWDIKKASAEHWLYTARKIIRSVRVEVHTETRQVSTVAYVRDPSLDGKEQGYTRTATVKSDSDFARDILIEEFARVVTSLHRCRELATYWEMEDEIEGLLDALAGVRERLNVA